MKHGKDIFELSVTPEAYPQYVPNEYRGSLEDPVLLQVSDIRSLYEAMMKTSRGVRWKPSVAAFRLNWASRLNKMEKSLRDNTYKVTKMMRFEIYEPKRRTINAMFFKDRVFQRSLVDNYLYDELTRHFIKESVACQKGKGTHYGINLLKQHMRNYVVNNGTEGWVVRGDIRHFFESIDHHVLVRLCRKYIRNKWALYQTINMINTYEKGLGLGSELSQLLALAMLNPFDHYVKEELKAKYYVRYSDDFVIIVKTKEEALDILEKCRNYLKDYKLELHPSKSYVAPLRQGLPFLGFRFKVDGKARVTASILPDKFRNSKRKFKRVVLGCLKKKTLHIANLESTIDSMVSHMMYGFKARAERFRRFCLELYKKAMKEFEKKEKDNLCMSATNNS